MKFQQKMYALILAVFCCFWASVPAGFCGSDVENAIVEIQAALDECDAAKFRDLVNIDGIIDSGLEIFIEKAAEQKNAAVISPLVALMLSGLGNSPTLLQLLRDETRAFVLNGVSSGLFSGKNGAGGQKGGKLAPLFSGMSTGRKELLPVGAAVKENDGWLLPFRIHDYGNDLDYGVIGYFENSQGKYRLVEVRNLGELFDELLEEANR